MFLREYLTKYTKEELLDQARSFEIKKCSGLRKADLIDRIVDTFCAEEMLRSRLACLTKEQMDLFRKACISPTAVSVNEVVDAMQLYRYWIGYFEDPTDRFCVFEDVAVAFSKIDDKAFQLKQCRKGWLVKCIHFFIQYYEIAPIEVIYEMYRQKVKDSIDEMIEILWEMPVDIVESCLFTMDKLGMEGWPKENPLYSEKGIFVHLQLFENEEFDYLLRQQMDKDFYIPSVQQIDEICRIGYEASSSAYKKLESFYRKSTHNRRERPVCGHRGGSRGPFYYRITTFGKGPWDARDPHKTTFMALKHVIRLSIWQRQKETPGVEKAPGVSSPQRKESGRSGRDDGELRFGYDPAIHVRRLRVYHRPRRLRMASRISIFFAARRFEPLNSMG